MDYYSILGVNKQASQDEIKKAFRKAAMANHPDRTGGDDTKFKQINEAYDTLKDPQRRAEYDNPKPKFAEGFGPNGFQGTGAFEDLFQQFGFGNIHRRQVRNKDVTLTYTLEFKDIFTGRALSLSYNLPSGKKKYIDITVPAGVKNGDVVNFQGYGDDSIPNFKPGNLHLKLRVPNHPKWKRDEDNITCIEKVDIFELMLGTNITIETPTGKEIALSIHQGTKPGTTFSVAGYGVPNVQTNRNGNLYVKIEAIVPKINDPQILHQLNNIRKRLKESK